MRYGFFLPIAAKWEFALPALFKCICGNHEAAPSAGQGHFRNLHPMCNFLLWKQDPRVASSSRQSQFLTLIYMCYFSGVFFGTELKKKSGENWWRWRGKIGGRWTCYFPS